MRSLLRVVWRLPVAVIWTGSLILMMVVVKLWPRREPARRWATLQRLFQRWARGLLTILGVRLDVRGEPPSRSGLLVCNHLGYLDIVVLTATLRATFVSKSEVASWPLLGPVVTLLGTIYVNRARRTDVARVNRLIADSLGKGRNVVVFPEGTSSDGSDVLPFRASLLEPCEEDRHPIHYARLHYSTPPGAPDAAESVCWWGDAPFLPHVMGLLRVPHVHALVHFGNEAVIPADRKTLAVSLREKIRALPTIDN